MKRIKFLNLLFSLILTVFIVTVASASGEASPTQIVATALVAYTVISILRTVAKYIQLKAGDKSIGNYAFMAVQTEVWESEIAENLFKDYSWIKRAKDRTGFVIDNAVVHIPQAGAKVGASKNREVYPIPVVKRNDADVTYALDEISTDATHIPHAETLELSYDKLSSTVKDHFGVLGELTARDLLDRWYPSLASQIVRTSGADTAVDMAGQTGTRKKFIIDDVDTAKTLMVEQTKKETGNRALICSEKRYKQLKSDTKAANKDTQESVGAVWSKGDLIQIHGFDIIRTDVTGRYTNASTPAKKDYNLALEGTYAADDNDVVLLIDFAYAHFAEGTVTFFENKADAQYQGDIYSALKRIGGRLERADQVGVVAIVQTP